MTEHRALERKVVFTGWVGHDGRTACGALPTGKKQILHGHGIGTILDLLPSQPPMLRHDPLLRRAAGSSRSSSVNVRAHPE